MEFFPLAVLPNNLVQTNIVRLFVKLASCSNIPIFNTVSSYFFPSEMFISKTPEKRSLNNEDSYCIRY